MRTTRVISSRKAATARRVAFARSLVTMEEFDAICTSFALLDNS
jgi:hypothetical protein